MFEPILQTIETVLGLQVDPADLSFGQMAARAIVMFAVVHQLLRFAPKRFFATRNAVDLLLALLFASFMSRAINGDAAFLPTIGVGILLVFLYRWVTWLTCRSHRLGRWLKGVEVPLIVDGVVDEEAMKRHRVSPHDLQQDLRLLGSLEDPKLVRKAVLERNGEISVIRRSHVFTVGVENGVQTVRIEIAG